MGRTSYVQDDIAKGRLVVPFEIKLPVDAGFYLVSPEAGPTRQSFPRSETGWRRRSRPSPSLGRSHAAHAAAAVVIATQSWQNSFDGRSLRKFDVLVIGGGNAALCAAISARRAGASVLVAGRRAKILRAQHPPHPQHALRP